MYLSEHEAPFENALIEEFTWKVTEFAGAGAVELGVVVGLAAAGRFASLALLLAHVHHVV